MNIELTTIKIWDLFKGYENNNDKEVVTYNGILNVRSPYQREFVYKDKQRDAVIEKVINNSWQQSNHNM